MNNELIVCIDCGDTIVDESTQVFADNGNVLSAREIPGAVDALRALSDAGYRLVLVADGRVASFHNILSGLGVEHVFEASIISEALSVEKPNARMFQDAMDVSQAHRMVMIGNNLKRDVLGANRMGMISILLSYSPRYDMHPETDEEVPDYMVAMPQEVPPLLAQLEIQVKNRRILDA